MERFLRFLLLSFGSFLLFASATYAASKDGFLTLGTTNLHYGVYDAQGEAIGDILYFHGFGDRYSNHQVLFDDFNRAGFRVIGFDLPSHGETTGVFQDSIDFQTFEDLVAMASEVLNNARVSEDKKPLFLAGWSLGGLLATRILQVEQYRNQFPKVSGLILYSPAFSPKKCIGNFACQITNATLTHNEALQDRVINPKTPLLHAGFFTRFHLSSLAAWKGRLPDDLSTLVLVADDRDAYVNSSQTIRWVGMQRANYVSRIAAYRCLGAKHELDNETDEFGGSFVRSVSVAFAAELIAGELWKTKNLAEQAPCQNF